MPVVVVTGPPCSGKTTAAAAIRSHLRENHPHLPVVTVSEEEILAKRGVGKDAAYSDPAEEKAVRGEVKAAAVRSMSRDTVVIVDAPNYIKGFRYELYCASKSAKTTQCTVHCDVSRDDARTWNAESASPYSQETFDALFDRYEAPKSPPARWDAPLLLAIRDRPLDCEAAAAALLERRPPPPNQSTQSQPLSSANFVHELDRVTKEIVSAILQAQRTAGGGADFYPVPGTTERVAAPRGGRFDAAGLARSRRQFSVYSKNRAVDDVAKLATMFVQYLNATNSGGEDEEEL